MVRYCVWRLPYHSHRARNFQYESHARFWHFPFKFFFFKSSFSLLRHSLPLRLFSSVIWILFCVLTPLSPFFLNRLIVARPGKKWNALEKFQLQGSSFFAQWGDYSVERTLHSEKIRTSQRMKPHWCSAGSCHRHYFCVLLLFLRPETTLISKGNSAFFKEITADTRGNERLDLTLRIGGRASADCGSCARIGVPPYELLFPVWKNVRVSDSTCGGRGRGY